MNSISKTGKILIGSMFMLIGSSSMGVGVYSFLNPIQIEPINSIKKKAKQSCEVSLKQFGFEPELKANGFNIAMYGVQNWESDLISLSSALKECNGYKVVEFCYGTNCYRADGKTKIPDGGFMRIVQSIK